MSITFVDLRKQSHPAWPSSAKLLTPEEMETRRAAENCPHKVHGEGCCGSARCGPTGAIPGQLVTIADCLACVTGGRQPPSATALAALARSASA